MRLLILGIGDHGMNQYILYLENEKSDIEMFARLMAKLTDQPFEGVEERSRPKVSVAM